MCPQSGDAAAGLSALVYGVPAPWQPPAAPPPAAVLAACWPPAWVPGPAGVPADGPDPAVTSHCGEYDWPHVTLPTRLPPPGPPPASAACCPGGQHQDRCQH